MDSIHHFLADLDRGIFRSPNGVYSEAKIFVVLFKIALLYAFVTNDVRILADWGILIVIVATFVAPDLLKKIISLRVGVSDGETRTTKRESSSTVTTKID